MTVDLRASSASLRLKHDLGKYVRLSAPDAPEADVEELRRRLVSDLAETRRTPEATRSAAELFDAWNADEGPLFEEDEVLRSLREEISEAIEAMRPLLPRLGSASREELLRLDALSRAVASGCAALHRETARRVV